MKCTVPDAGSVFEYLHVPHIHERETERPIDEDYESEKKLDTPYNDFPMGDVSSSSYRGEITPSASLQSSISAFLEIFSSTIFE